LQGSDQSNFTIKETTIIMFVRVTAYRLEVNRKL